MRFFLFLLLLVIARCASNPRAQAPTWVEGPSRRIDHGYLVYVERGDSASSATTAALRDVASECTFIPKGTRIEDRFEGGEKFSYVKVALLLDECEQAQKAIEAEKILALSNSYLQQQLKTSDETLQHPASVLEDEPREDEGYLEMRRSVVVTKQAIVLGARLPPEQAALLRNQNAWIHEYVTVHPALRYRVWAGPRFVIPKAHPVRRLHRRRHLHHRR